MSNHTHAFLSTAPCGCPVTISLDNEGEHIAGEHLLREVTAGYSVRRLPKDEAKALFIQGGVDCPHTPKWGIAS